MFACIVDCTEARVVFVRNRRDGEGLERRGEKGREAGVPSVLVGC